MTAITTILGMLGMALDSSDYGSLLQPLAIIGIGGMAYATLMTLLVVPILYDILNRSTYKRAKRAQLVRNTDLDFKEDEFDMEQTEIDLYIKDVAIESTKNKTDENSNQDSIESSMDQTNSEEPKNKENEKIIQKIKNAFIKLKKIKVKTCNS